MQESKIYILKPLNHGPSNKKQVLTVSQKLPQICDHFSLQLVSHVANALSDSTQPKTTEWRTSYNKSFKNLIGSLQKKTPYGDVNSNFFWNQNYQAMWGHSVPYISLLSMEMHHFTTPHLLVWVDLGWGNHGKSHDPRKKTLLLSIILVG